MKILSKGIIMCVVVLMILNMASAGYAQDMVRKLYRGVVNIATGWIEIPKNIYDISVQDNIITGIALGLSKGGAMAVIRTAFGVYDTMTFPFPIPEGYNPLLEPEFVFKGKKQG